MSVSENQVIEFQRWTQMKPLTLMLWTPMSCILNKVSVEPMQTVPTDVPTVVDFFQTLCIKAWRGKRDGLGLFFLGPYA